jgi:hypothetical protein
MNQPFITQKEILQKYQWNIDHHESAIYKLRQTKKILAVARLSTITAGLISCWYFWPSFVIVFFSVFLFAVIFTFLVFRDVDKTSAINDHERLIRVNRHELDAMQHNLGGYEDGQIFADPVHAYAADLDLFGPSSLFQYLSRCHADQSKKLLADVLKTPVPNAAIKEKQAASAELSQMQSYCQKFQSAAIENPLNYKTENKLKYWMCLPPGTFQKPIWRWFRNIYPLIPIFVLILFIRDDISRKIFIYCLIGFYFISWLISRKIVPPFDLISNMEPEMNTLFKQFYLLESEKFKSTFLHSLQNRIKPAGYDAVYAAIGNFNSILKKIEWRHHMLLNPILQIFFIWDLRLIILLNDWKKKNQLQFNDWFNVIAEMEVLISLASLVHNEPEWCFPDVDENYFHFQSSAIGHPLIPVVKRVTNDFLMEGKGKIALVTGSNMAGKSTFLRSLGINTVLAGMGAPVCARQMNMSAMNLISSMRIADNLAENTSTFYAELKKLRYIIESVNRKEKVFILLDEVLRGTNSTDRHRGSQALVRQLLQSGAVAVMATHDTELAYSESMADDSVSNYHFEGKIIDDELYFDYKIKKGICESLNATTLMKKIGIHFQE